jgi:glycosyltransferase involved in cell wall biosynthesis
VKVLAVAYRHIESAHSGYDLRVANLCRQLPGERQLLVVPLSPRAVQLPTIDATSIFTSVRETPALLGPQSARRHLRLSDDNYLRRSQPAAFAAAADRIHATVREEGITHAIVFDGRLAEFAPALRGCELVLDVCDSRSLTGRRELHGAAHPLTGPARWKARFELLRSRSTESRLPDRFDCVTTISEPDRQELLDLHGPADNLHVVPNGVEEWLLAPLGPAGTRRGITFWGNLEFGPNLEAIRFFIDHVFLPFLSGRVVEFCVVGGGAPPWLVAAAKRVPGLHVTGFVPELADVVGQYPIMINPMRTGSGLKNKVLEAFGLGLAVVSTRLGVDALVEVRDGEHLVLADEPAELSRAILDLLADDTRRAGLRESAHDLLRARYPWDVVGRHWRSLLGMSDAPTYRAR